MSILLLSEDELTNYINSMNYVADIVVTKLPDKNPNWYVYKVKSDKKELLREDDVFRLIKENFNKE